MVLPRGDFNFITHISYSYLHNDSLHADRGLALLYSYHVNALRNKDDHQGNTVPVNGSGSHHPVHHYNYFNARNSSENLSGPSYFSEVLSPYNCVMIKSPAIGGIFHPPIC